jgi:hypothetical protein
MDYQIRGGGCVSLPAHSRLERLKKYCSHSVKGMEKAVFFGFWRRFGSVTGFIKPAPSPKPRQKPKILAPKWLQYFFNRSKVDDLAKFPEMGRMVPEENDKNIREIILRPYRLFIE